LSGNPPSRGNKSMELFKDWWWLLSPRAGHRNCPEN
jgi:hypothetical protein